MPPGIYKHKKGYKRPPFSREWKDNLSKGKKGKKFKDTSNMHRFGEKSANWKGGNSVTYKLKQLKKLAPRQKPEQCEICGAFGKDLKKGLCFDHDHETGEFRGWICGRCNLALGLVKDKVEILELMIKYLKNKKINK